MLKHTGKIRKKIYELDLLILCNINNLILLPANPVSFLHHTHTQLGQILLTDHKNRVPVSGEEREATDLFILSFLSSTNASNISLALVAYH